MTVPREGQLRMDTAGLLYIVLENWDDMPDRGRGWHVYYPRTGKITGRWWYWIEIDELVSDCPEYTK